MRRIVLVACLSALPAWVASQELLVAAAANTRPALETIARGFERDKRAKVTISYGASGIFASQIENGAPFDVFLSADTATVDRLIASGRADPSSKFVYAVGKLVLAASREASPDVREIADLGRVRLRRLSLPNPETAPYGAAARESMQRLGLWERLRDKIVFAENVRDSLRYAETGDADFAFAASSEARRSGLRLIQVGQNLHAPLRQAACVLKASRARTLAEDFVKWLGSAESRSTWNENGYEAP
jgi:molybdate transport system substrate-binding protein